MKRLYLLIIILAAVAANASERYDSLVHNHLAFAWGADAGASIDLTGNDMSDVNFSTYLGMSKGWINFVGIGAAAAIATANSCRSYDVFAAFHTNFVNRPTLFFWPVRIGIALNYLEHNHQQTGIFGTTGLGINLARGKGYCSYIVVGYTFRHRWPIVGELMTHDFKDLHMATIKIGVSF